jgi:hypothetical protein
MTPADKRELEVIEAINKSQNLSGIYDSLFTVTSFSKPSPAVGFEAPEGITLYKSQGGSCLGEAKDSYGILQPDRFFQHIVRGLLDLEVQTGKAYDFDANEIEYVESKGGKVISFKIPLREIKIGKAKEVGDVTEIYALFQTSFDGSIATSLSIFSKRVACTNMAMFTTQKDSVIRFKHTEKQNKKAVSYVNAILKSSGNVSKYEELLETVAGIEIRTERQVEKYLSNVLGYDVRGEKDVETGEFKDLHKKRQTQVDGLMEAWEIERESAGNNVYGLFQAVTHYTNWADKDTHRGFDFVTLNKTGVNMNLKAEKEMLVLATR